MRASLVATLAPSSPLAGAFSARCVSTSRAGVRASLMLGVFWSRGAAWLIVALPAWLIVALPAGRRHWRRGSICRSEDCSPSVRSV
jgi:hypothetical protein